MTDRTSIPPAPGLREALTAGWNEAAIFDVVREVRLAADFDKACDVLRAALRAESVAVAPPLDVDVLAAAINDAQITEAEIRLGHDLRVPAERIAKAYDRAAAAPHAPPALDAAPVANMEEFRKDRGWPTPNHMRRAAEALDIFTAAKYGDVLRWIADLCDASLPPRAASPASGEPARPGTPEPKVRCSHRFQYGSGYPWVQCTRLQHEDGDHKWPVHAYVKAASPAAGAEVLRR